MGNNASSSSSNTTTTTRSSKPTTATRPKVEVPSREELQASIGATTTTKTTKKKTTLFAKKKKTNEPANLFVELRDMSQLVFGMHSLAFLFAAARILSDDDHDNNDHNNMKTKLRTWQTLVDGNGTAIADNNDDDDDDDDDQHHQDAQMVMTVWTPSLLQTLVQDHSDSLWKLSTDDQHVQVLVDTLVQQRHQVEVPPNHNHAALTVIQYDDVRVDPKSEVVFAIAKDDANQRLTLIFRGTPSDNLLLLSSSGKSATTAMTQHYFQRALHHSQTKVQPLPELLQRLLNQDQKEEEEEEDIDCVWVDTELYQAIRAPINNTNTNTNATTTTTTTTTMTKYQQVVQAVQRSMKAHPGYFLYVTGHGRGAGLATLFGFFLASEPNDVIPLKPVVTCTFASPRVGDSQWFFRASQTLERHHQWRLLRVVYNHDPWTVVPLWNHAHVGFQLDLPQTRGLSSSSNENDNNKSTTTNTTTTTTTTTATTTDMPLPQLSYPKAVDTPWNRLGRAWNNSVLVSTVAAVHHHPRRPFHPMRSYDPNDYWQVIRSQQAQLQDYPAIQTLYRQPCTDDSTGFSTTDPMTTMSSSSS